MTSRASGTPPPVGRAARRRTRSWFDAATSTSVLALSLLGVTLLAAGPLQEMDQAAHGHWAQRLTPGLQPFVQQVLDPIAGQAVCLPVLVGVAGTLAWRHRTWRPLECVVAAEVAFYGGVGLFKVLLARPAPTTDDAGLFDGGLQTLGWSGISYPSGHAAEAILIYGTAVYLVGRWTSVSERTLRGLRVGVGAIALNAVAVSYYLGWHWVTDLVGGLLVGGLLLRLLIEADRRDLWRSRPRRARTRRGSSSGARREGEAGGREDENARPAEDGERDAMTDADGVGQRTTTAAPARAR
ncbi:phosphatase PAP2 family protein [Isoptericola cucumis]|uniref:phosphatase PAP2 family protein n=1 Tax=Isoptericola cucumis TaxID=1776856 RepID=UPI001664EE8A|nr:phosphatase PAP2 family protein [Isoptericola cucumis]